VIIAAAYPGVSSTAVLPVGGKVTLHDKGLSRGSDVTNGGVAATGHGLRCAYGQGSVQGLPDAQKGSEIRIRRVTVARGEWFAENLIQARSSVFRPWLGSSPGSWTGGRPQKADERTVPQPSCVAARSSLTILVRLRPQEGENGEHAAVVVRCGWECEPFLLVTAPRGVGPSEQPYRTGLRRTQLRLILRGAEHYTFSDFASTLPRSNGSHPGCARKYQSARSTDDGLWRSSDATSARSSAAI
jgi:hypothetical protein